MDATFATRMPALRWPHVLTRWGVTPAVAAAWGAHLALLLVVAGVPFPMAAGSGHHWGSLLSRWGWWQDDVVHYAGIAAHGYLPGASAAYWPGVPLFIALVHNPWVALAGIQLALLAVMVGCTRVARPWGLTEPQSRRALWLFALNPAAVYYGTAYPELWVVAGMLLAMSGLAARRSLLAAVGATLATLADPLGAVAGAGLLWAAWRGWRTSDRDLLRAALAGVGAEAVVVAAFAGWLAHVVGSPLAMVRAQAAWHGTWTVPGVQIVQALAGLVTGHLHFNQAGALLALLVLLPGLALLMRRWPASVWRQAAVVAACAVACVGLAFSAEHTPLLSTGGFLSADAPLYLALGAGIAGCRYTLALAVSVVVAVAGGIAFTHGYMWW
jgi:hypothetical protein